MNIGNLITSSDLFLAPMAGVTDVGFRKVCKIYGAGLTFTEMISAKAYLYDSSRTKKMLITSENEDIKAVQLFGNSPEDMAKVAIELEKSFDIIDLNFGCPAPKIVKNGEGSALMKDIPLSYKIISEVVNSVKCPVSVKMRLGYSEDVSKEFASACEDAGANFITVHGRTREQMYSGKANYEAIASVKQSVKIPVVGNGDVKDVTSLKILNETGVDAVMIGRASLGKPWIFSELSGSKIKVSPFEALKFHVEELRKYYSESFLTKYLRKHFLWYADSFKAERELKRELALMVDIEEAMKKLSKIAQ